MPKSSSRSGSLKAADFEAAVSSATKPDHDLRSEHRFPCHRVIDIFPCAANKWHFRTAQITDCSLHGIGLIVTEPIPAGEQFLAKIALKRVTLLIYTVRHCRAIAQGRFAIGAEFSGYVAAPYEDRPEPILEALLRSSNIIPEKREPE